MLHFFPFIINCASLEPIKSLSPRFAIKRVCGLPVLPTVEQTLNVTRDGIGSHILEHIPIGLN